MFKTKTHYQQSRAYLQLLPFMADNAAKDRWVEECAVEERCICTRHSQTSDGADGEDRCRRCVQVEAAVMVSSSRRELG